MTPLFYFMELTFEEVVEAYFQCRKGKRRTIHALDFEFDLERNLTLLYDELKKEKYQISSSIAFVVDQPKIREIWSATFRDRIVHHIIYNRLEYRFIPGFIRDSFACMIDRGTLDGSNRLHAGMRSITRNWQKDAFYLGADVRNFFVSIYKPILWKILEPKIVEPWLQQITRQVLFHDPCQNYIAKSLPAAFKRVPGHKSLLRTSPDRGLPIGNLTSQFFANVYMNELDQFAKHKLKHKYYYRYVDDVVILHESKDVLNETFDLMSQFIGEHLSLEFHPHKKRIGLLSQGVDFVGFIHKPYRRYVRTRTLNKMKSTVHLWKRKTTKYNKYETFKLRATMNSYLGMVKWGSTYKLRRKVGNQVQSLFIHPSDNYEKLLIPNYLKK